MGLNFETLVVILALLIVVILADGIRRMMRERRSQSNLHHLSGDEDDLFGEYDNPELPGEVRVLRRSTTASQQSVAAQPEAAPIQEPEAVPAEPAPEVERPARINTPAPTPAPAPVAPQPVEPAPVAAAPSAPTPQPTAPRAEQPAPKPAAKAAKKPLQQEPSEVIAVHLVAPKGYSFGGEGILQLFTSHGLVFGDMNIFHAYGEGKEANTVQFSMANAVEPGVFNYDTLEQDDFVGFTFFLALPGPQRPLGALDEMLSVVTSLAKKLGAEMKDEHRSVLTQQTMEHLRERVREFERRSHLVRG
ncbi:MAG TPA: cell division protein ZipA [Alcanivoracaceae bacterium]|nr:cell division protein ZipA [Alcanivoracaceae bacterium]